MRIHHLFLILPLATAFVVQQPLQQRLAPLSMSTSTTSVDPKDAVRLFGRLAEKYIVLDESAGMCCYSACSDCEYRLPGGGYRMADQSAARPKWIPSYTARAEKHTTKWSLLFEDGPLDQTEFCERVKVMEYAPPLGGPYVGASAGSLETDEAIQALWNVLAGDKEKLTAAQMSKRLTQLANGEQGVNWAAFQAAF